MTVATGSAVRGGGQVRQ